MPLETGNYISDLVSSNPTGSDNKSTSDDHLRLLKKAIKQSFPAVAGAVTKTHAELNAAHDFRVPTGGIIMWSGALLNIPVGWLLCNGTNGTPNLLDRFIVGAGGVYAVGDTGGSKDATLPAHSHTATLTGNTTSAGNHSHGVSDPGHQHAAGMPHIDGGQYGSAGAGNLRMAGFGNASYSASSVLTSAVTTGISLYAGGDHTHSMNVSGNTSSAGVAATNANLPPYYALAYIMKAA